ncbi:FKBP-type 22 kDa peptidyl-prolyl cis-trans isomerase [Seminavis robusta]|uniref:peptidylprolyl isomerase n=1 Tax=Seminavis robusta TaxID=568900 RepID=A0A9N8D9N6_9STRA|nr:FKBP-type 22 kDa peptidyl-prolyl cis-trans isomerase [Seminavis robusta]|eukprot:Sro25_g017180.1 FKBP-type 22 kDa peptidyl-prolyl cis-trans isomerase (193) ;mRNA; f:129206-129922
MISAKLFYFFTFLASAAAWTTSSKSATARPSSLALKATREDFLKSMAIGGVGALLTAATPAFADETLPSGVTYTVKKAGNGPKPDSGELVAIRFAAFCGSNKIDDIFSTPEPYYTRVGSGGLLKGVESTLPLMRVGDRWELTIPSSLAFGSKGRPASAGKPRIPSDATIIFDVEMVGLPGKEPELIELMGDV